MKDSFAIKFFEFILYQIQIIITTMCFENEKEGDHAVFKYLKV